MVPPRPDSSRMFRMAAVVSVVAAALMVVFHDVRIPLDGCAYAVAARNLDSGVLDDVFRWSHLLHVPVLWTGWRFLSVFFGCDLLTCYRTLDILAGSLSLGLLFLLVVRVTGKTRSAVVASVFVLVSWVFWIESVTADEKMFGFLLVMVYLNLLIRILDRNEAMKSRPGFSAALVTGGVLAGALLLHASAILLVPASVFLAHRHRAWRFALASGGVTAALVSVAYVVVFRIMDVDGWMGIKGFFSSGVSSYSVFATGLAGTAWVRSVVQGTTKLVWAVFSEDGLIRASLFAALQVMFLVALAVIALGRRANREFAFFALFGSTVFLFGLTYAPDAPDTYFLAIIPIAIFLAEAMVHRLLRVIVLVVGAVLLMNNAFHYLDYSRFRDARVEERYMEAIAEVLEPGDHLVVLGATRGMEVGTQGILPVHRYFNPELVYVEYSEFAADPGAARWRRLAEAGRLFVEGLCFDTYETREDPHAEGSVEFRRLGKQYDLVRVVDFADYSSLHHRTYKHLYSVRLHVP